jgi:methylated-DNA-[protein]-cysteine S-methyltransferase
MSYRLDLKADRSLGGAVEALRRYFEGDIRALDRLEVDVAGTPFQRKVWTALRGIPVGSTTGYGMLARKIGAPGAARAVGLANGRNPVAIVIPCHRVVAHDGTLGGYGGGLRRKEWLLQHEGALLATGGGAK